MKITTIAKQVAERTSDAYSFDRYASWAAVAQLLLDRGYNEAEAEEIMRSKWTRWAADTANTRYGRTAAKEVIAWMESTFKTLENERAAVIAELMASRVPVNPLHFCGECLIVSTFDTTCPRCKIAMKSLDENQKAAYVKSGVRALTDKKFVLWKDEGDVGSMRFLKEDPDIATPFVFKASAPSHAASVVFVTKSHAKQVAKSLGMTFREG